MKLTLSRFAVLFILGMQPVTATAQGVDGEIDIKTSEEGTLIDITVFVPSTPAGQIASSPADYARDRTAGCLYAVRNPLPEEFADWTGECDENGYASGPGFLAFTYPIGAPDGYFAYVEGNFREGRLHGEGNYALLSGSVFRGMFVSGRRTGQGTFYNVKNGETFSGSFIDDKPHGLGTVTYTDGHAIRGLWQRGKWVREIHAGY